jgi:hypothetical protein
MNNKMEHYFESQMPLTADQELGFLRMRLEGMAVMIREKDKTIRALVAKQNAMMPVILLAYKYRESVPGMTEALTAIYQAAVSGHIP